MERVYGAWQGGTDVIFNKPLKAHHDGRGQHHRAVVTQAADCRLLRVGDDLLETIFAPHLQIKSHMGFCTKIRILLIAMVL